MRIITALWISVLLAWPCAVATTLSYLHGQETQEKQEPEPTNTWIVIYEDRGWNAQGPYIEIRIMVKADKEGEAVAQSMKALMDKFGSQNCGHLKFKECVQKSNAEKK